jgi:membrane glycosyltransferase
MRADVVTDASASSPGPVRVPFPRARRVLFFGLVAGTTLLGALMMLDIVRAGGVTALEIAILALFVPTFGWISISFWNAMIGFALQLSGRDPTSLQRVRDVVPSTEPIVSRTALVVPARNEDPARLMDGIAAMVRSLEATGDASRFDVHLLSDTTDTELARREEAAWQALLRQLPRTTRLHYRRRADNVGRKAGNIADFCARWGRDYDFMVVLDADSVMSGPTLVELVHAMQANPRAGLIQTVPIPARQETPFGRFVQFAGALYSPMLATGQAFWQTHSANYWGHNAIVRVRPFIEHCTLPTLPGEPPLGGPVLSHDFVEAALLRRGGWLVYLLPRLGGSWEEVPANVVEYAKRDRRWAQGSLQHLLLLRERGLKSLSRVHFVFGAMGYLSSVLWLLLLLASTLYVLVPAISADPLIGGDGAGSPFGWLGDAASLFPLLGLTAVILFLPKALGVVLAGLGRREAFGGAARLCLGALLEASFAVLVAPLLMIHHAAFVVSVLAGRDVEWAAQERRGRELRWREAWRRTAGITAVGAAWAGVTLYLSPTFFLWLTPIFTGLLLAAPIVQWTGNARLGRWLQDSGVLVVPSESLAPRELQPPRERPPGRSDAVSGAADSRSEADTGKMHEIERGLFELRSGRPLLVVPAGGARGEAILITSVEGLDACRLAELRALGSGPPRLVVTSPRARAMGVREATNGGDPLGMSLGMNGETPTQLLRLSSTIGTLDTEAVDARPATDTEAAALRLIRLSGLVPAVVSVRADPDQGAELRRSLENGAILEVHASRVQALALADATRVEITHVSDARVPLEGAENARFILFREAGTLLEHVAVLIGERADWPDPVPVRLHSACLTGDLFGSLRCDCGEQLRGSLLSFASSGGGVLVYLQQEGRGIGLGNKLRAYELQEVGLDTVDADGILGFGADERRYGAAVGVLRHLGIERVKLLTNNPDKVRALESGGIRVVERVPLHGTLNDHNLRYVRAKVQRAGHWLGDMLHGAFPSK